MENVRKSVVMELKSMKTQSDNEKDAKTLSKAIMLIDGEKHKAIWQNKEYYCPVCENRLNPSYMKECPECHIKILYKKSGSGEF